MANMHSSQTSKHRLKRIASAACIGLVALVFLASLVINAMPEPKARALIGPTDWVVTGGFFNNAQPKPYESRLSIAKSNVARYWRSWSPETGPTQGVVATKAFRPARFMMVPYGGFAGSPGIEAYLLCIVSGARKPLATARTNNQWVESPLFVPKSWCPSDVQVVVRSTSSTKFIEVGTPFEINAISYLKTRAIGQFAPFLLCFLIIAGAIILIAALAERFHLSRSAVHSGIIGLGVLGFAFFFLYFYAARVANGLALIIALLSLAALAKAVRNSWRDPVAAHRDPLSVAFREWSELFAVWLIAATALFFLAQAITNGAGPWTPNARFAPVQWSTDNQIPALVAEFLFHGEDVRTIDFGPWKISDRPPLMYGLLALLRAPVALITASNEGHSLFYQISFAGGLIINTLAVPIVLFIGRQIGLSRRHGYLVAAMLALTPFVIFNSIYIWPKLLGGAFGILALWTIWEYDPIRGFSRFSSDGRPIATAATLSALALMSHGGTVFGILAMLAWTACLRGLPRLAPLATGFVAGIAIILPWSLWQHFEQPPGNALIKFAFANTFGFGEESKGVLATIQQAYSKLTWIDLLKAKGHGLMSLLYGYPSQCGPGEMSQLAQGKVLAERRITDFIYLGPSLNFLGVGIFIALLGWHRRRSTATGYPADRWVVAAHLLGVGVLGVLLDVVLTLDCYINHHQSYESILEILLALILFLTCSHGWLAKLALALAAAYTAVVWIIQPFWEPHVSIDGFAILGMLGTLLFAWIFSATKVEEQTPW